MASKPSLHRQLAPERVVVLQAQELQIRKKRALRKDVLAVSDAVVNNLADDCQLR